MIFAKKIKYNLVVLTACMSLCVHAGEITVRQIPVAKELPTNTVYRMFQDKSGFVWFGTPNGFCRYDGYGMKNFRSEIAAPTFPSNYITGGFTEDTLNRTIWIGTEKGVLILDEQTHGITLLDTALLGESPIRQVQYSDNGIWVCSDLGLYLYNPDKSLKKKYLAGSNSIHIDNLGTVRVTVWNNGMYYLDRTTDTFLPYPQIGNENSPHKIFQDNTGDFWICTWGDGLYRFYPDRKEQEMYERVNVSNDDGLGSKIFYDIEQSDVNGYLWVLSYSGVTVFKPDGNRIVPVNEFTSRINGLTNLFSDIMKDRDGNLWLGTYEQGAIVVDPDRSSVVNLDLQFIRTKTNFVPNIVKIFEDKDGELWIKQSRLGIFALDPGTFAIRQLDISDPDIYSAIAICNNSETNEIWVAVEYAPNIYRFRKSNGKIIPTGTIDMRTLLPENMPTVRYLHEDRNGVIWAATNSALLSWKHNKWQIVNSDCGTITGIAEDSFGTLWLGTAKNGLLRMVSDGDKTDTENYNVSTCRIAGNNISCISAGSDGQLWFCVNGKQLYSYDISGQQFTDYTQKANLNNFEIFNIIAGDNGHIWISGNKQVVEFNPLTAASVQYDVQNDLIVTSLHRNSMIKTRDGSVVFGGNKGLCIFTPSMQLNMPCNKVKTVITDIKINGKPVYQREAPVLLPSETNLEINFSSFNYLNPGKTRYAYKLEGVDKQWIYTESGRSFAVYNQLQKGEYTFLVRSTGDNQLWSNEITRLTIRKKPAFYETGWAYAGYTLAVLFILLAGLKFYINRIRLRDKLHIAQLDKEKSEELIQTKLRFFTNIGHEFRTPLTLIMTPLNTLIHQLTDENLKQKLTSIYRNAEDMLGLINQLLDFRKLEMGGEKLKPTCDDFVKYAEYVFSAFRDIAGNKSIQFSFESDVKQLFIHFDRNKIQKIFNNLYSNALKFTPDEGYITTTLQVVQEENRPFVRIDIADSGCGISEKEQEIIFERFYQSENSGSCEAGSGIGLHLVKEYVELHGGRITVSSRMGEGSTFSVFIPADSQVSCAETDENKEVAVPVPSSAEESPKDGESKTVLIVEDNAELRHFLAEQLESRFNVLQTGDGMQGLSTAQKKLPDLIVSDLMMPELSGLEMCQSLKSDIQTSHIPIILLTAKLSDETKIEGYRAGADSFITKPFNFEVLLARIEMLIEQQEKRKKMFHKTVEITPSSITVSSLDEELIKKALLALEKNMDNSEYSVDELASELAFSRRQLSRKFQSIIGLSPAEFICSVRLKRAAQLLKDSQYNISEISDRVGFNTIRSFNQNFKEEFGVTPTQYRAENAKPGGDLSYQIETAL